MSFLLQCANTAVARTGLLHPTPPDGTPPTEMPPTVVLRSDQRHKSDFPAFLYHAVPRIMSLTIVEYHVETRWLVNSDRTGLRAWSSAETSSPLCRTPDLHHGNLDLLRTEMLIGTQRLSTKVIFAEPASGRTLLCISTFDYPCNAERGDNASLPGV